MAAFVDAEHALDAVYAGKLGVDIDNLLVSQPDTGEQALEIAEVLIRSGAVDVLVVDSVAALVPRAELEGEMGDAQMGMQARLMSQALRKLTAIVSKSEHLPHLHQPAAREDRRDVRQPRDHDRRPRAQVLLLGAARHPPHRLPQGRRRGHRQPRQGEGGQEQGGPALPRGRVRHPLRRGHQQGRRPPRPRRRPQHHREVRRLVRVRRRAHGPGPRERPPVPEGQPRHPPRGRLPPAQGPRPPRPRSRRRSTGRRRRPSRRRQGLGRPHAGEEEGLHPSFRARPVGGALGIPRPPSRIPILSVLPSASRLLSPSPSPFSSPFSSPFASPLPSLLPPTPFRKTPAPP